MSHLLRHTAALALGGWYLMAEHPWWCVCYFALDRSASHLGRSQRKFRWGLQHDWNEPSRHMVHMSL